MDKEITANSETIKDKRLANLKPFPKGVSGNPSGRPKDTMKDYVRQKFMKMTPQEKEDFLKKVAPEMQWRMGEGNPTNEDQLTGNITIEIVNYGEDKNTLQL